MLNRKAKLADDAKKICASIYDKTFFNQLIQGDQASIESVVNVLKLALPDNLPTMQKSIHQLIKNLQNIKNQGFDITSGESKELVPVCKASEKQREQFKKALASFIKKTSEAKDFGALLPIPTPTEFLYCSSPDSPSVKVNAAFLNNKLGFTFSNTVYYGSEVSKGFTEHFSNMETIDENMLNVLLHSTVRSQSQIEIFKMGDKQGHAPRVKSGMIKKHSAIAAATGKSCVATHLIRDDYSICHPSVTDPRVSFIANMHGEEGGVGFLFAHAPTAKATLQEYKVKDLSRTCQLDHFEFQNSADPKKIATANVFPTAFLIERPHSQDKNTILSTPIYFFMALRDIQEGEVLCFDYELFWWVTRNAAFDLFDKRGRILDPNTYSMKPYCVYIKLADFADNEILCAFDRKDLVELARNSKEARKQLGNFELTSEKGKYTAEVKCDTLLEHFEKSPRACGIELFEHKDFTFKKPGNSQESVFLTLNHKSEADIKIASARLRLFPLPKANAVKTLLQDGNVQLSQATPKDAKFESDMSADTAVMKMLIGCK